jgi:hypothetical protein
MLAVLAGAKDKKPVVPASVLRAETIAVIIEPEAGESITNPGENRQAREAVESALRKWGRYHVLAFPEDADLIVAIRRASGTVKPTITGLQNDRPVVLDPGTRLPDGSMSTTIGISRGSPPPMTQAPQAPPGTRRTEIGPAEDTFTVYLGNGNMPLDRRTPLDAPPLWRYMGKNALSAPNVKAVQEFEKTVDDAAKVQDTQTQKKP